MVTPYVVFALTAAMVPWGITAALLFRRDHRRLVVIGLIVGALLPVVYLIGGKTLGTAEALSLLAFTNPPVFWLWYVIAFAIPLPPMLILPALSAPIYGVLLGLFTHRKRWKISLAIAGYLLLSLPTTLFMYAVSQTSLPY